jgi:hypothetical protein
MAIAAYPDTIQNGPNILPIDRIKLYSPDEWEKFIEEWVDCLKPEKGYSKVERIGGAGDMGRDISASTNEISEWDNYQCKHYDHPLVPSEVWKEFGKLAYYTFRGDFTYPRKYYFIAPQGLGTSLSNLLKKPNDLKKGLIDNWEKYCKKSITTEEILLTDEFAQYVNGLDFSIFDYKTPLELIDQHRKSPNHLLRFGGGLPIRPEAPTPPVEIQTSEIVYIKKLLNAYADHLKLPIDSIAGITDNETLKEHLKISRRDFFSAEALRLFSRDSLPSGSYQSLQEQFHDGIRDELNEDHPDGLKKVKEVIKTAKGLQITNHPLVSRMQVKDRGGICHQLANEKDDVKWVR